MCFYVHKHFQYEHIADSDILVYKILRKSNKSSVCGFKYKPHKTYRLKRKLLVIDNWSMIKSQKRLPVSIVGIPSVLSNNKYIHHGFHSYISLKKLSEINRYVALKQTHKLCLFVIPRGAKYYYNPERNEYVSTSIRSLDLRDVSGWLRKEIK